jgi:hypothetical protein
VSNIPTFGLTTVPPDTPHELQQAKLRAEAKKELASRELARRTLRHYIQRMMPEYVFDWVHDVTIEELQKFWEAVERQESPRLAIFMPPRVGKSQLSSIFLPSWGLGRSPKKELVITAYAANLADEFSKKTRELLRDPDYQLIFPNTKLHKDMASVDAWRTTQMGGYASVGVGGGLTGKGADLLILDDLYKDRADADSDSYRKMVEDWFKSTAYTRIQPGGGFYVLLHWQNMTNHHIV